MKLLIRIKNKDVTLDLICGSKKIGSSCFPEKNNLSEKLLPAINKLLKKNKMEPKDIQKILVNSDTPGSFTTPRIAKSVEKAWNWGVSMNYEFYECTNKLIDPR